MIESNFTQDISTLKNLPKSWTVCDFADIFADISGGNKKLLKSDFLVEGKIAVVDQGKKLIAGYINEEKATVKGIPPYIVFGDHTRILKFVDFPFAMGADGTKVLKAKDKTLTNDKYLFHFLKSLNIPDTGYNRHFKYLKSAKIPLPPLPQQQKIANILDAADALRQNDKALIAKYDELTQALFLDMFGDPVSNPKNLPKIKLGELGKWQSGGTPSRSKSEYYNGTIPWLSSGELNEMYVSESKEHITETAIKESSTRLIEKGSLLLGMYDTAALKSTISTIDITCNQAIAYSKLDDKLVSTVYAYFIIQIGKEDYKKFQRGVRQKNLNLSMIKNLEILLPHLKLQNQFAERVSVIEEQKAIVQKSLEKSESLFNSLLQKAFKGELA
jgi:type I restriction enzyme S subunit